jgi:hypothetical protein
MSSITINTNGLTTPLQSILAIDLQPGAHLSYQDAKILWIYHPLAAKLVEKPITLAMSKPRKLEIDSPVQEQLIKAFQTEWQNLGCDNHIRDLMNISRAYGVGALAINGATQATNDPIDFWQIANAQDLYVNTYDALNLAGSVVTNQNPNAPDFQKPMQCITAAGQPYHPSKTVTMFHGTPIYLDFQSSSFSFSGRSIFLRSLYPLKSFVQSMMVDDLVSLKSGVIIAKTKQPGSIINNLMQKAAGYKRQILQEAQTGNVISIEIDEEIESINLQNTDKAMTVARDNIIANIASGADVPAIMLKSESMTHGFGEGTEDSKQIVQYIDHIRAEMRPAYEFFDKIVMHRAWNEDFFATLKNTYPDELANTDYKAFFYKCVEEFECKWPSLMEEPESELAKVDESKVKNLVEVLRTLLPIADPENKAKLVEWAESNLNQMKHLFNTEMTLDFDALAEYVPPTPLAEPTEPKAT